MLKGICRQLISKSGSGSELSAYFGGYSLDEARVKPGMVTGHHIMAVRSGRILELFHKTPIIPLKYYPVAQVSGCPECRGGSNRT